MSAKILLVDDEKEIIDLIEIYLKNEGYEVAKFERGQEALDYVENNHVDLAILDVMLPDVDGFTICRKIRENYFFPIIMLTAKVEDTDKVNGIMLGADDYITKPFKMLELIARVRANIRRAQNYNVAIKQQDSTSNTEEKYLINGLEINASKHTVKLYDEVLELTPIEFNIVLYLARHEGMAVSSEELFEAVWKEKYFDSNNTVFVHIARIREKMHENSRKPIYIKTVWGVGYKL